VDIFGQLPSSPAFRSELLHFIRLSANYAASIFIDCRERAQSKHRKQFAEWLTQNSDEKDGQLWTALVSKARWFDALKADFSDVIRQMPVPMQTRLERAVQHDHVIPWDLRRFELALIDLREYRHWLEHYDERQARGARKPVSDERLLQLLGLTLLPHLNNHLLGRMRHYARRKGLRLNAIDLAKAKTVLDCASADRREASRYINGLKRRVDADTIRRRIEQKYGNAPGDKAVHRIAKEEAKKRRDLETRKASLVELHQRYFDQATWPRYNLENFLIRFAFIGRGRIMALESLLGSETDDARMDFIQAIEPAFDLSMDIALILHEWMSELEQAGVPIRNKKKAGPLAADLRNAIAHGGWFWDVRNRAVPDQRYTFAELLGGLLDLPNRFNLPDAPAVRNALLTRLEACLRAQVVIKAYRLPQPGDDPNRNSPPLRIRRWTPELRAQFADRSIWRIERRPALKRLAATWMRDLAATRKLAQKAQ